MGLIIILIYFVIDNTFNVCMLSRKDLENFIKLNNLNIEKFADENKDNDKNIRLPEANIKERTGCRWEDDLLTNDMKYTDYNHLPMADGYASKDYEYGYSYLPPEKWYPQPPFPPICLTPKQSVVCPLYTTGTPLDVKEWNSSIRITSPDNINVKYIKEKLNSGR